MIYGKVLLTHPIELGGVVIKEFIFDVEPKVKHLKGIKLDNLGTDALISVAGRLCNQTPVVIGELSFVDAKKVADIVLGFLDDSPPTIEQ